MYMSHPTFYFNYKLIFVYRVSLYIPKESTLKRTQALSELNAENAMKGLGAGEGRGKDENENFFYDKVRLARMLVPALTSFGIILKLS